MPDEPRLREQARHAIQNGKLPRRAADRTWGGPGVGAACAVCERPMTKAEMEIEIEVGHDGADSALAKYHLHPRCFAAWEFERTRPPQP